jgi:hypothetical protein
MIKNFQGFLFESNSPDENYKFHFIESDLLRDFSKKFRESELEELNDFLDPLHDDFGIDFKVYPYLVVDINTKVGFLRKLAILRFNKKIDANLGELSKEEKNNSGNQNLLPQLGDIFPRYQEIGRDLNQIYLHISRIMDVLGYKEIPTMASTNRVGVSGFSLGINLQTGYVRNDEIGEIYNEYIKSTEFNPKITKWYEESMKMLRSELPDSEILCQFVEGDNESSGHWDIYVFFEEEYYSLSSYWLDDDDSSIHFSDIKRLKQDISAFRKLKYSK